MAKKVIQMYDKYKSTTKIYPKVIKECFQEDAQEYIEGQVVANPELAGTENSLTGLQVGDTKYKVELPINVVANPTLAGTESELEGIQIGDTKYKMPSGGGTQLYQHNIFAYNNDGQYNAFGLSFISNSSTPFSSMTDLQTWLATNFKTSGTSPYNWKFCPANGQYLSGANYRKILGLTFFQNQNEIYVYYVDGNNAGQAPLGSGYLKFTDIVLTL